MGRYAGGMSRGGILFEDLLQERRQLAVLAPAVVGRHVHAVGLDEGAAAIGVGAFVERIDGSQNGSAVLVDQIDSAKVPAGVAHGHFAEVTIPCRNLEPHALERDRSIALTLTPLGFQAKRVAKRLARRARAEHVRRLGEALDRRAGRSRGAPRGCTRSPSTPGSLR